MSKDTDDDLYPSEDDLDEDEATQYIIEQSLIQYRKLKGLNPRLVAKCRQLNVYILTLFLMYFFFDSDLIQSDDPDEIFKAIKVGKMILHLSKWT